QQAAPEQRLLLVAAGEVADALIEPGCLDAQLPAHGAAGLPHRTAAYHAGAHELGPQRRDLQVLEDAEHEEAARFLAILGKERDAVGEGGARRVDAHPDPVQAEVPGARRAQSEQRRRKLAAAGAHESREAENLARAQLEADVA